MATRNYVPRANGEGSIGTEKKHWGDGYFDRLNVGGHEINGAAITASRIGETGSCFYRMASGLTIMWGDEYNTATNTGRVIFPISFATNAFSVAVNVDGGTESQRAVYTKNMTKTGFDYQKMDSQTGIRWIAVGI